MDNKEIIKEFLVTKEMFKGEFKHALKLSKKDYKYVTQFPIVLPFLIPIPVSTFMTMILDDCICAFFFSEISDIKTYNMGRLDYSMDMKFIKKTRVEMLYISNIYTEDEEKLSNIFDKLLQELNKIITAYISYSQDVEAYKINLKMLPMGSLFKILEIKKNKDIKFGFFILNMKSTSEKKLLDKKALDRMSALVANIQNKWNPFIFITEHFFNAHRYEQDGLYKESIISIQIFVETFLKTLFINLLVEEGKSISEAEEVFEELSFIRLIKNGFHTKLKGNWDYEKEGSKIGQWYENTYKLRNKIVHGGYAPTTAEVNGAIASGHNFVKYIITLIRIQKKKYPKLNEYFLD